jgi:hypothetical protein
MALASGFCEAEKIQNIGDFLVIATSASEKAIQILSQAAQDCFALLAITKCHVSGHVRVSEHVRSRVGAGQAVAVPHCHYRQGSASSNVSSGTMLFR